VSKRIEVDSRPAASRETLDLSFRGNIGWILSNCGFCEVGAVYFKCHRIMVELGMPRLPAISLVE